MFEPHPTARADLTPGAVYAIAGERAWIYYGQVAPDQTVGFFRHRGRTLERPETPLAAPLMCVVSVGYPSIGRALRAGDWKRLGRHPLAPELTRPRRHVVWPVATLIVTVFSEDGPLYDTRVDDPAIQDLERAAVWDAQYHVPQRLTVEFGAEAGEWDIGGPIWRERQIAEERARRWPEQPWHRLPEGWVPTGGD